MRSQRRGIITSRRLPNLTQLNLRGSIFSDAGSRLKGLRNLHELCLDETKISDEGMKHLGNLPSIEKLSLWGTNITDAGPAPLVD